MGHNAAATQRDRLPDAETLRHLYQQEGKTIREIARSYRCRTSALLRAMDAAGIARRRPGRAHSPLPDWNADKLRLLVKVMGMPHVRAFARGHGVNRIKLAGLLDHRLLDRGCRTRQIVVDHDADIRRAYDAGAHVSALAQHYNCSRRAIAYSLNRTSRKQCATDVCG